MDIEGFHEVRSTPLLGGRIGGALGSRLVFDSESIHESIQNRLGFLESWVESNQHFKRVLESRVESNHTVKDMSHESSEINVMWIMNRLNFTEFLESSRSLINSSQKMEFLNIKKLSININEKEKKRKEPFILSSHIGTSHTQMHLGNWRMAIHNNGLLTPKIFCKCSIRCRNGF